MQKGKRNKNPDSKWRCIFPTSACMAALPAAPLQLDGEKKKLKLACIMR